MGAEAGRPHHVLIVVENIPLGVDHRVRKQVEDLLRHGYVVSVVTMRDPTNASYRRTPGLTVLEYPPPREPAGPRGYVREYVVSFAWATLLSARARLRGPIDVVQLCQPPDIYFPLARVLRRAGARVLVDQRDLMPELFAARYPSGGSLVPRVLHWLERRTQAAADYSLSVNGYLERRLVEAGAPADRVAVVRNGPVLARVDAVRPDPSRRTHRSMCCWVGKMGRQDRLDLLVQAVDHLVHRLGRVDVQVVVLGDGECLDELRALTARLGLEQWLSFPGWVSETEVFTHLATADVGLDTSLQDEVSPVKVMEYMAFGLPFVAFDLPETRQTGDCAGVLVPAGDVEGLASAVAALLDDDERRALLGRAGRERVREDLAWERQSATYLEVVDACARSGSAPAPDGAGRSRAAGSSGRPRR